MPIPAYSRPVLPVAAPAALGEAGLDSSGALIWHDGSAVRKSDSATVNPAAQLLAAVATYVTPVLKVPAGTASVGSTFRCSVFATNTASVETLTVQGKVGAAGTTADTTITGPVLAAGTAVIGSGVIEVVYTVRTLGSSGVVVASIRFRNGTGVTGMSATSYAGVVTTATMNTTVDQFLGLALSPSVASVITVQNAISEVVRP